MKQPEVSRLFPDDTVMLPESERMLQSVVDETDWVCKRRKLKVNVGKSKGMMFERAKRSLALQSIIESGKSGLKLPATLMLSITDGFNIFV